MTDYQIPADFLEVLRKKYDDAVSNNFVLYNGENAVHEYEKVALGALTVHFQLTLLTSLVHRPESGNRNENPFEKPEPELTVVPSFGPAGEFRIVFNKFPVVPMHFLLVTTKFASQNTPLTPSELFASFQILKKIEKSEAGVSKWFAFFNSGPESGASQPHKHIQFMTEPSDSQFKSIADTIAEQLSQFDAYSESPSAAEPFSAKGIPFAHFLIKLPTGAEIYEMRLATSFSALLQRTLSVLKLNDQAGISYNFIMTTRYMFMVPRSKSKFEDRIGINSCGFQGLVLCKNEELFEFVKKTGPLNILSSVSLPNIPDDREGVSYY
ncbi:uncharacterized protein LODBEIA_P40840 [Lodderomyces beijingensis]|uniref:Uncharacterized protein n=1 Tax=Lodderomyces beijingensis TaxID=1775926 RepID=A0ABP0ZRP3_9ASCO